MKIPEFKMYVGPMFGGKTTRMLSQLERYQLQNSKTLLIKPKIDDRYGSIEEVSTHNGVKFKAISVSNAEEIRSAVYRKLADGKSGKLIIAVDEAFMIEGCGEELISLFFQGHTILVASLQLSASFHPYKEVKEMMPYATSIEVCPAICVESGMDAYYTEKICGMTKAGTLEVGGADMYRPVDWYIMADAPQQGDFERVALIS